MWKLLKKWAVCWKKPNKKSDNYIECLVKKPGQKETRLIKCESTGKTFGFHLQVIVPSSDEDPNMIMLVEEHQCPNKVKFWKLLKEYNKELEQCTWEDGTPLFQK